MIDKNNAVPSKSRFLKPLIVAGIILIVAWIIGKGALMLIASVKNI